MPLALMNTMLLPVHAHLGLNVVSNVSKQTANYSNNTMFEYKPKTILASSYIIIGFETSK